MSANDKTGVGAGTVEWQTPPELFARLNRRYQFDYDAFASHKNHLCDEYSTVDGLFWISPDDERYPLIGGDGFVNSWENRRVWVNPPYARGLIEKCATKILEERERAAVIVVLVNAATETAWFRQLAAASFVEYLPQRVAYVHPPFPCKEGCTHAQGEPTKGSPSGGAVLLLRDGAL